MDNIEIFQIIGKDCTDIIIDYKSQIEHQEKFYETCQILRSKYLIYRYMKRNIRRHKYLSR